MRKFVSGIQKFREGDFEENRELFERLAHGQSPPMLLITCSDSRIDPNRVTQAEPGELFVLRTAGNIVPPYGAVFGGEAATIEYAVNVLKVHDIVVCGHSHCGAMAGLLNLDGLDSLPAVKEYLSHAEATRRIVEENYSGLSDPDARLKLAIQENVLVQLENLRTHPAVAAAVGRDDLALHGWVYEFETGAVNAYDRESRDFREVNDGAGPVTAPDRTTQKS